MLAAAEKKIAGPSDQDQTCHVCTQGSNLRHRVVALSTVTRRASGVVGGSALQWSMAVGAQAGRTSPRGVCVVIIMTSCVGAVGSDERAHACSASRRFMSLHVYSNY